MSYDLKNRVALVTGAARKYGIGHAIALRLARDGADVVVVGRASWKPTEDDVVEEWRGLDSVVEEVASLGRKAIAIGADVTKSQQIKSMVERTLREFGKIDILVNNAGILGPMRVPVIDLDEQQWQEVMTANLTGPFLCSKEVARAMVDRGQGGKIVNISSIEAKIPARGLGGIGAYGASKAALINLTMTMAMELARHKINVNAVCPGRVATEINGGVIRAMARSSGMSFYDVIAQRYAAKLKTAVPLGRASSIEDQANAVAFLASSEADFITGVALNVAGGEVMAP